MSIGAHTLGRTRLTSWDTVSCAPVGTSSTGTGQIHPSLHVSVLSSFVILESVYGIVSCPSYRVARVSDPWTCVPVIQVVASYAQNTLPIIYLQVLYVCRKGVALVFMCASYVQKWAMRARVAHPSLASMSDMEAWVGCLVVPCGPLAARWTLVTRTPVHSH